MQDRSWSQLLQWDIWFGALISFLIPYGISRVFKWLRNE